MWIIRGKSERTERWELQPLQVGKSAATNRENEERNASEVWELMGLRKATSEEDVSRTE